MSSGNRWFNCFGGNDTASLNGEDAVNDVPEIGTPRRRRRMLSRRLIGNDNTINGPSSGPRLNPRAVNFIRSTMSGSPTASNLKQPERSHRPRDPIIRSEELFSGAGSSRSIRHQDSSDDFLQSWVIDEESDSSLEGSLPSRSWSSILTRRHNHVPKYTAAVVFHETSTIDNGSKKTHYLPLTPSVYDAKHDALDRHFKILPSTRVDMEQAREHDEEPLAVHWRPDKLPVEIFELITNNLSREDIKAMRLVNREFEEKVSLPLFRTAVVPFNTELYDMIEEDVRAISREPNAIEKGEGKARDAHNMKINWQNATSDHNDKVYMGHGLRVFQGFGRHIRRFGMSFEVSEEQMENLPEKKELETFQAYHGEYDWPTSQYARFANLAGLEKTADETSRMKAALSNLTGVQELGLSMDSGLGWLSGPDRSIHSKVFMRRSPIFDASHQSEGGNAKDLWLALQDAINSAGSNASVNMKEQNLCSRGLPQGLDSLSGLRASLYQDPALWPPWRNKKIGEDSLPASYVLFTSRQSEQALVSTIVPSTLRKEQKEWLLETEWAQRAFLESYMLAIVDNYDVFSKVTKLSVAKISSGLLNILGRGQFWDALPKLADVAICVSADWRTVSRDSATYVQTAMQQPSDAVRIFQEQVLGKLSRLATVKKLRIGYMDGGEHAEGMFARNNHLLPAPIVPLAQSIAANPTTILRFPHVEQLALVNCWLTPPMLEQFVHVHARLGLKTLILDSVSLTTHPRFTAGGNAGQANQQGAPWHVQLALLGMAGPGLNPATLQQFTPQQIQILHTIAQQQQQVGVPPGNAHAALFAHPYAQHLLGNAAGPTGPPNVHGIGPLTGPGAGAFATPLANVLGPAATTQGGPIPPLPVPQGTIPPWLNNPAPLPLTTAVAGLDSSNHWASGHQQGSWPDVIDRISTGSKLRDHLQVPWDQHMPEHEVTMLKKIEFISCGYARLTTNSTFDQSRFDRPEFAAGAHEPSPWFRERRSAISGSMMQIREPYHGKIWQCIPQKELDALLLAWGLREGWDGDAAEIPEFDGFLAGGTGRFSGVLEAVNH